MMNRSYLPFLSAREYQDRGMAKWMGFFLSEHSSSLWEEKNKEDVSITLSMEVKVLTCSSTLYEIHSLQRLFLSTQIEEK